jgi:imidazole glycerol-phosphate synthase subunit HisF
MLAKRIIACLDIRAGRVVKGRGFRDLRDAGDPVERVMRYRESGVDEIAVLDVSATIEERLASRDTIAKLARAIDVPLTAGGGVRTIDDFARLLEAGADKVALNTAALASPRILSEAASRFGSQCVVLSIDARRSPGGFEVCTHSANVGTGRDAIAWARLAESLGAGELLLTSIDRDGTRHGFDIPLITSVCAGSHVPVVASGGARDADSFAQALMAGADAALGASVFHDGDLTPQAVKRHCAQRGLAVRE